MQTLSLNNKLLDFINGSPTAFHAAENISCILLENGFTRLSESCDHELAPGGKYFFVRNDSAVIAFALPMTEPNGFAITAAHLDSPCFKIKQSAVVNSAGLYAQLSTERYGGMILSSWMDRPLSAAGRVFVRENGRIISRLVNFERDLCVIPNVAIHMNRNINDGVALNPAVDMLPMLGDITAGSYFDDMLASEAGTEKENILSHELMLYPSTKGIIWGADNEYISSARLDDLQCAFACLMGFLAADEPAKAAVYCAFDNEEVGSGTRQGADSEFLNDVLSLIADQCGKPLRALTANSFMISADNAHAVHPNHPEYADRLDRPEMNKGIVVKYNANQLYTTDAFTAAVFGEICRRAEVPTQRFTNRADMRGGSTLGNISSAHVSIPSVDIGLPQLSMHSAWETAGARDTEYLVKAVKTYYETALVIDGCGADM